MARIAFVINPLASLDVKKDTTLALVQAALQVQHEVYLIQTYDLQYTQHGVIADGKEVQTVHVDCSRLIKKKIDINQVLELSDNVQLSANDLDIVFMRQDPPVNHKFLATVLLLAQWEEQGVQIVNSVNALLTLNEKLNIMRFPKYITKTLVSADINKLVDFVRDNQEIVIKPLHAMGGAGVVKVNENMANLKQFVEKLTHGQTQMMMAQEVLDVHREGDKRILLFNGKPLPYALARYPQEGSFLANLASGGTGKVVELTSRDQEICKEVSSFCFKNKLAITGLDVIDGMLTEVNITSPTCLREIQTVTRQEYSLEFMQGFV